MVREIKFPFELKPRPEVWATSVIPKVRIWLERAAVNRRLRTAWLRTAGMHLGSWWWFNFHFRQITCLTKTLPCLLTTDVERYGAPILCGLCPLVWLFAANS